MAKKKTENNQSLETLLIDLTDDVVKDNLSKAQNTVAKLNSYATKNNITKKANELFFPSEDMNYNETYFYVLNNLHLFENVDNLIWTARWYQAKQNINNHTIIEDFIKYSLSKEDIEFEQTIKLLNLLLESKEFWYLDQVRELVNKKKEDN